MRLARCCRRQLGAHRDNAGAALRRRPLRRARACLWEPGPPPARCAAAAPATRERGGVEGVQQGVRETILGVCERRGLQDVGERGLGRHSAPYLGSHKICCVQRRLGAKCCATALALAAASSRPRRRERALPPAGRGGGPSLGARARRRLRHQPAQQAPLAQTPSPTGTRTRPSRSTRRAPCCATLLPSRARRATPCCRRRPRRAAPGRAVDRRAADAGGAATERVDREGVGAVRRRAAGPPRPPRPPRARLRGLRLGPRRRARAGGGAADGPTF